jgi:adenine-specific DNA-methyltransferase
MRYIGNKSSLLSIITPYMEELIRENELDNFVDVFGGIGCVGEYFKNKINVYCSELLYSSYLICKARITLSEIPSFTEWNGVINIIKLLQDSPEEENYIFNEFSEGGTGGRLFFSSSNGRKIDGILKILYEIKDRLTENEFVYLYYILLESIHNISNTTGVYGAFLKKLQPNAIKPITLNVAPIQTYNNFTHIVLHGDSYSQLSTLITNKSLLYLDPPYNARQYSSNYHVLETISYNNKPTIKIIRDRISVSGLSDKLPMSNWCSKQKIKKELKNFLETDARYICMSYNSESLLTKEEVIEIMNKFGNVRVIEHDYKRYKSNTSVKKNVIEYLFICTKYTIVKKIGIIQPPVQWVGGKRRLLDKIKIHIPDLETHTYYEPFLGGGSLLFNLQPIKSICSEKNKSLHNVYTQIKTNPNEIMRILDMFHTEYFLIENIKGDNSRQSYYNEKKDEFNEIKNKKETTLVDGIRESCLFIFLNHTCFNGMYRESSKGLFNVPFGKGRQCSFYDRNNILQLSEYLKSITILNEDFRLIENYIQEGDIVYLDPPYHKTFSSYDKSGWTEQDTIDVLLLFNRLTLKKVHVILSNSNTDEYKQLIRNNITDSSSYTIYELSLARTLNSNSKKRAPTLCELLLVNQF